MNIKLDLLDYQALPLGETQNGVCPACGKRKFYVTRKTTGLAYICFRASCHTQGFIGERLTQHSKPTKKPPVQFTEGLLPPSVESIQYFFERFNIELGSVDDAMYYVKETDDGRYAFPIWGRHDERRGVVIRAPLWSGEVTPPIYCPGYFPKAKTYLETTDTVRGGWYHSTDETHVVIVEDQVSAMRVAGLGVTAYALLGTTFSQEHLNDLMQWKNGKAYTLALDPDAIKTALKILLKWHGCLNFHVVNLECDPKDYPSNDKLVEDLGL